MDFADAVVPDPDAAVAVTGLANASKHHSANAEILILMFPKVDGIGYSTTALSQGKRLNER